MRLLLVEEDADLGAGLTTLFCAAGDDATYVTTGQEALDRVAWGTTDLLILDLDLPDMDGVEVCRRLRANGFNGGVLVTSARHEELDIVAGLDAGADDYVVKPAPVAELLSRVRSVMRRVHRHHYATAHGLASPRLEVLDHHITFDGIEIATRGREFGVLAALIARRGRVVLHEELMDQVWGTDWNGSPMVLSVAVGRIRARLEAVGSTEQVENVRGVGFRIVNKRPTS